jgi:hypothetical protein
MLVTPATAKINVISCRQLADSIQLRGSLLASAADERRFLGTPTIIVNDLISWLI